jgi:membrane protease subunit (stomatin/prohibitin family)
MPVLAGVVTTLDEQGREIMGPDVLLYHHPSENIRNGSYLTVESNHFCVLKSRGAILEVYETGQYQLQTPNRAIIGQLQQGLMGGNAAQFEAIYLNRSKLVISARGKAFSKEMAELSYEVGYYIHIDNKDDAVKLVQHMPYSGHYIKTDEVNSYVVPVVEQAINQVVQSTPLEQINEKIHDLTAIVQEHLQDFLSIYGITLNDVKVLVYPTDAEMKRLISLRAFGMSEKEALRAYLAIEMAKQGLLSAPNALEGMPFVIGGSPLVQTSAALGSGTKPSA